METPAKIRLLGRIGKIFPAWAIEQQARVIERAFDTDLSQVKDAEARQEIEHQRYSEASEFWDALAELRSSRLMSRARKLHVPLDNLEWQTGNYGNRYLTNTSEVQLYRAVRDESQKVWDFRIKVIVALTGFVGTLIGLVSVWKK